MKAKMRLENMIFVFLSVLEIIFAKNVERALPEGNIRGTRKSKTLVDGSKVTVDVYYGVRYGTADRWAEPKDALQRDRHVNPEETPYCPNTSTLNQTEDCLTLDLFIPKDFDGNNLALYLPPNPTSLPYAPTTFPMYDGSILSAKLNTVFALVRSRQYLFGYLNFNDTIGNFGLSDQKQAVKFMTKSFKFLFGREPSITVIGDYMGAEQASYHLFDSALSISKFVLYGGAPNYRKPIDDISIYQNMCKVYMVGEANG